MDLLDVKKVVDDLFIKHGLMEKGWRFEFDKAVRRLGCCKNREKIISLSKQLTELNLEYNYSEIYDAILHEVAHAITRERFGTKVQAHGPEWKAICIEIGGNGQRLYDSSAVTQVKGKFVLVCPNCGNEVHLHRRPSGESDSACRICCRKYNRNKFSNKYVLILKTT
jgi:predicted SprT family Zn-dependent metalloprotease